MNVVLNFQVFVLKDTVTFLLTKTEKKLIKLDIKFSRKCYVA